MKVSAIIPCFNEEVNIRTAIESVLWADEIIVVDSFSTDNTQNIVREYPQVKLLIHEYINSATQKNWVIPQAEHEWIFLLDADEVPTPELIHEIKGIINSKTEFSAFWISRRNKFMDKELKFTWRSDAVIRLFKKDNCRYEDKQVHAEILTTGKVGKLKNYLLHDTYKGKGLIFHLNKGDRYTTWAAHDYAKKLNRVGYTHLILRPMLTFIKHYFIKGNFLDGKQGLIISALTAWNVFIRFVKVWRILEGEQIEKR